MTAIETGKYKAGKDYVTNRFLSVGVLTTRSGIKLDFAKGK